MSNKSGKMFTLLTPDFWVDKKYCSVYLGLQRYCSPTGDGGLTDGVKEDTESVEGRQIRPKKRMYGRIQKGLGVEVPCRMSTRPTCDTLRPPQRQTLTAGDLNMS